MCFIAVLPEKHAQGPIYHENNHTKRAGKWALFTMVKGPYLRILGILII